jgi:hypothetical protein
MCVDCVQVAVQSARGRKIGAKALSKCKNKANPLKALTGPEVSRRLRISDIKKIGI